MNALLSTSDQYTNTSSKKIVHCNGQYYVHCKYYAQYYAHYNAQYYVHCTELAFLVNGHTVQV